MQKSTKVIMWIIIGSIILLLIFLGIKLIFDKSWWWFFTPLIIELVFSAIGFTIWFITKKGSKKEETKPARISPEQAEIFINEDCLNKYAEYFDTFETRVSNEGTSGKPKTPVFHKFGKGYESGKQLHFMISLSEPDIRNELQQKDSETEEKFNERVSEALSKFAAEPEIFETEETETLPTGQVKTIRKKQTIAEKIKEEEAKEAEASEDI